MVLFVNLCSQDKIYDALIPSLALDPRAKRNSQYHTHSQNSPLPDFCRQIANNFQSILDEWMNFRSFNIHWCVITKALFRAFKKAHNYNAKEALLGCSFSFDQHKRLKAYRYELYKAKRITRTIQTIYLNA